MLSNLDKTTCGDLNANKFTVLLTKLQDDLYISDFPAGFQHAAGKPSQCHPEASRGARCLGCGARGSLLGGCTAWAAVRGRLHCLGCGAREAASYAASCAAAGSPPYRLCAEDIAPIARIGAVSSAHRSKGLVLGRTGLSSLCWAVRARRHRSSF